MKHVTEVTLERPLDLAKSLQEIIQKEKLAVLISRFMPEDVCKKLQKNIEDLGVDWYPNCTGKQGRIGIGATEFSHRQDGKETYFSSIGQAEKNLQRILDGTKNPCDQLIELINPHFPTARASEVGYGNYFCGLIRAMGSASTLHYDFAPTQARGWSIDRIGEQLAVVFYFSLPESGGSLRIYERRWTAEDEAHNNDVAEKGPFGFSEDFLSGVPFVEVMPKIGDVIIFNSRNFHMVTTPDDGSVRFSMNAFLGSCDNSLIMWN